MQSRCTASVNEALSAASGIRDAAKMIKGALSPRRPMSHVVRSPYQAASQELIAKSAAIQTPFIATASPTTATGQAVRIAAPAFATMSSLPFQSPRILALMMLRERDGEHISKTRYRRDQRRRSRYRP
jgi:hypothetical protein